VRSLSSALRAIGAWIERRTGLWAAIKPIAEHPVPAGTDWRYVLGSATLVAFLIQVVTGTALATLYVPSTDGAYPSLQFITHAATFGRVLRGMHYFGASAMMILIGAHMGRVFLTGSFKFPREVNWLSGAALLLLTLAMAFTGQLLRWDQDGVWSIVIAAAQAARVPVVGNQLAQLILGGPTIGGPTLTRAFAVHVFFVPGLIFAGVGLHLYLLIRNGISEVPKVNPVVDPKTYQSWYHDLITHDGIPFWPDAAWRDAVMALLVVVIVTALAITIGPSPLGLAPDPSIVNASPRPDWYFLWYFAVLAVLPPSLENTVIVLAPVALVLALILLPFVSNAGSRRLRNRPFAVVIVLAVLITIGYFWQLGVASPWSPAFTAAPLTPAVIGTTDPTVVAGAHVFHARGCEYCHTIGGQGGQRGPDLTHVASRMNRAQIVSRILGGATNMPAYALKIPGDEFDALVTFLQTRR
jgi:ubiquinol-cytochrome c reductase cytochrome b subunit